jgi:hypothetical protein
LPLCCSQPDGGGGNSGGGGPGTGAAGGQRYGQQGPGGPRAGAQQAGGGWQGGGRPAGGQQYAAASSPGGPAPPPQQQAAAASSRLLALLQSSPREQQSYLLFIEACDSHRLNSHIARCMAAKLQAAMRQAAALPAAGLAAGPLGELMQGACTLAHYLCYLGCSWAEDAGDGAAGGGAEPAADSVLLAAAPPAGLDVGAALEAALRRGQLLLVLPWLHQYLWLAAALDKGWAERLPFARVLPRLQQLAACPELQPGSQGFGPAALCLRSLLEDCLAQAGLQPAAAPAAAAAAAAAAAGAEQPEHHRANGGDCRGEGAPAPAAAQEALQQSLASPLVEHIDARYLELCCPGLEALRRQLTASSADHAHQGGAGARHRREAPVRQVPQQQRPPPQRLQQLPRNIEAALAARQDPARLALQQALLAQYSTDGHLVKMRDVVNTVADVLAVNGFSAALRNVVADALPGHLQALAATVEQVQAQQEGQEGLAAALERAGQACSAAASGSLLQAAMAEAQQHIARCASRAVPALLPADLPEAVAATAAALAAEAAAASCAQRLLLQVRLLQRCIAGTGSMPACCCHSTAARANECPGDDDAAGRSRGRCSCCRCRL